MHNFEKKDTPAKDIPDTLVPARPGDWLMIIIPNYWGKGATIAEAKKALEAQYGKITGRDKPKQWRVRSVHPDSYVSDMGGITYPSHDHPPLVIASSVWPLPEDA